MKQNLRLGIDFPVPQQLAPMPYSYNYHGSCFVTGEERYIYWLIGYGNSTFYRYDTWTDSWNQLASAPVAPSSSGYGSAMVFDPSKQRIYAVFGNSTGFAYYDIKANYWVSCATLTGGAASTSPVLVHTCTDLHAAGNDDYIYYNRGDAADVNLYRYSISTNTWTTLTSHLGSGNHLGAGAGAYWLFGEDPDKIMFLRGQGTRTAVIYSISAGAVSGIQYLQNCGGTINTGSVHAYEPTTHELFWVEAGMRNVVKSRLKTLPQMDLGTATSGTSTTLTKTSAGWTVNRFTNAVVAIISGTGAGQTRDIVSNTADTLTVTPAWTTNPASGSVYEIYHFDPIERTSPTSVGTNSITVSGKTWVEDRHAGSYITIISGAGAGQIKRITSNSADTIYIYGSWNVQPNTSSIFEIKRNLMEFGSVSSSTSTIITDSTRTGAEAWPASQWVGAQVRIYAGTGAGQIRYITASAATTITVGTAFTTTPDSTSKYEIVGFRSTPEIYIPYSTSASYQGNTMATILIKGLLFVYCSRKNAQTDWFRWMSITP